MWSQVRSQGRGALEWKSHLSHPPETGGWAFVSCISKSLGGDITCPMRRLQLAEVISLEKGAIRGQHCWMGSWPRIWLAREVTEKHSLRNCGHHTVFTGRTLSLQTAVPPTTQPWLWQPSGASSMSWRNTPQQMESCGRPH